MSVPALQRVVLCGGAFSDNLGDAVIADCLANALRWHLKDTPIVKMDISGRREYGHVQLAQKRGIQKILNWLPPSIGQYGVLFAGSLYFKRGIEPVWRSILQPHDTVVIGGGQLFQDEYLNFPLKLFWLQQNLKALQGNFGVYAVGVSSKWSWLGRRLFGSIIRSKKLLYCSVRDENSKRNLRSHFPSLKEDDVELDPDPALLSEIVYRTQIGSTEKRYDIGLCLMHPQAFQFSAADAHSAVATYTDKWNAFIGACTTKGLTIALFTNGAREDEDYLQEFAQRYRGSQDVVVLERATTPAEFVTNIASMRTVIAHRLHASIVSYALNIPTLGLTWDAKVNSFYAMCERSDWLFNFTAVPAETLVEKAQQLLTSPIDNAVYMRVIGRCQAGVERLARNLVEQHERAGS